MKNISLHCCLNVNEYKYKQKFLSNFTDTRWRGNIVGFIPKHERFTYEVGRSNSVVIRDLNGHYYSKSSKTSNEKGEERWQCQKQKRRGCKVTVKTVGDFIIAQKYEHTHEPDYCSSRY